jgi:hypothetical protein
MRKVFIATLLATFAACSDRGGEVVAHVPLKIAGVTYQWPVDSTTDFDDLGRPEKWRNVAYIPIGVWNEIMSPVPGLKKEGTNGQLILTVSPARTKNWDIKPDGAGLPFLDSERFEAREKGEGYILGEKVG